MALASTTCLRISSFILVVGLCVSKTANWQQQKPSVEEEKYFPREFKLLDNPTTKITTFANDQGPSQDDSSDGTAKKRKTLIVWMKSFFYDDRGLTVYDSGNLIYRIVHHHDQKQRDEVLLMDANGEVVFTIRRKSQRPGFPMIEGQKGAESGASSNQQGSFLVHNIPCNCLHPNKHLNAWDVIYDDNHYSLNTGKIEKSSNVKMEFKLMNEEGKTIAELKQEQVDGRGIPLGRDMHKLEVEPETDVPFAVAIVTAFGMINDKI